MPVEGCAQAPSCDQRIELSTKRGCTYYFKPNDGGINGRRNSSKYGFICTLTLRSQRGRGICKGSGKGSVRKGKKPFPNPKGKADGGQRGIGGARKFRTETGSLSINIGRGPEGEVVPRPSARCRLGKTP